MPGQFPDKKTVCIPPDIAKTRSDVEGFMIQAANSAMESGVSAQQSASSAAQSAAHADESQQYAQESKEWSERNSQGIHFAPGEPADDRRFDGMLWLQANEAQRTIVAVKRFDASETGNGVYPSESLFVSDDLYLNDSGAWIPFTFDL